MYEKCALTYTQNNSKTNRSSIPLSAPKTKLK